MSIEMTVSEIAEVLGLSRQAINNRVKELPEEDTKKNDKQLDQQQQLTLQAMKDQENLQLELDQAKKEVQATKKGFFARLFGG